MNLKQLPEIAKINIIFLNLGIVWRNLKIFIKSEY